MISSTILRRLVPVSLACASIALLLTHPAPQSRAEDKPAAAPSHQVIACYFHRTNRCPTCKKISSLHRGIREDGLRVPGERRLGQNGDD